VSLIWAWRSRFEQLGEELSRLRPRAIASHTLFIGRTRKPCPPELGLLGREQPHDAESTDRARDTSVALGPSFALAAAREQRGQRLALRVQEAKRALA